MNSIPSGMKEMAYALTEFKQELKQQETENDLIDYSTYEEDPYYLNASLHFLRYELTTRFVRKI